MATIDNASAELAIALQLGDLDDLEASGNGDRVFIQLQRHQLVVDYKFDATIFEASRRLALSMAKAVEDDSALLAQSTRLSQIEYATFDRLALFNHSPPTSANAIESTPQPECTDSRLPMNSKSKKRKRSPTPEDRPPSAVVDSKDTDLQFHALAPIDDAVHSQKKFKGEQIITGHSREIQVDNDSSSVQDPQTSTEETHSAQIMVNAPTATTETPQSTADCASCGDNLTIDKLVKVSCVHHYCKNCFGQFIEASLETHDGFPPKCCKIPVTFVTVAENVSAAIFTRYTARQDEIKNATALYCATQRCGVSIEKDQINGVKATCMACWRDTCTICRSEIPRGVKNKPVDHVCKKDKAREQVLELARKEGWQSCYQCGNLVELSVGCHHMR